jgi:hypothetical protein
MREGFNVTYRSRLLALGMQILVELKIGVALFSVFFFSNMEATWLRALIGLSKT